MKRDDVHVQRERKKWWYCLQMKSCFLCCLCVCAILQVCAYWLQKGETFSLIYLEKVKLNSEGVFV